MPGMNSGVNVNDPTVVAAFKAALVHQGIIALLIFAVLGLAWLTVRALAARCAAGATGGTGGPARSHPGRARLAAGCCGSASACCGSSTGSCRPSRRWRSACPRRSSSPSRPAHRRWVQHLVNWAGTTWSYHPMQAGASAVWIQVGIGIWLLAASRGPLSRLAGLASVGWGLVVWVFGESFGGDLRPGPDLAVRRPRRGAHLLRGRRADRAARAGLARPRGSGRPILAGLGLFLVGMAVLQAWPGRGFWQGTSHGQPGTLAGMTRRDGADTRSRGFLSALGQRLHRLRRGARVRGEPVRRGRAGRDRRRVPDRPAAADPPGAHRLHGAVPGGLGADRGLRLLRRPGHRPQQHDPVRAAGRRRVPRPGPGLPWRKRQTGRGGGAGARLAGPAPGWPGTGSGRRPCAGRWRRRASARWRRSARSG